MRRHVLRVVLALLGLALAGDGHIHAARCTPLKQGTCTACKNCRYCSHCAKSGGKCSVCK
jgi:hypothetical protein